MNHLDQVAAIDAAAGHCVAGQHVEAETEGVVRIDGAVARGEGAYAVGPTAVERQARRIFHFAAEHEPQLVGPRRLTERPGGRVRGAVVTEADDVVLGNINTEHVQVIGLDFNILAKADADAVDTGPSEGL